MNRKFWVGFFTGTISTIVFGIICFIIFAKYAQHAVADRLKPPKVPAGTIENYNFRYSTLDGQSRYISGLKGKVAFVNFWGTWCIPCVAEMPTIQKLYDNYKNDTTVTFIIASRQDDADKIRAFAAKHNYTLPFYMVNDTDIPASMKFNQYPATFIYTKSGEVAMKHINGADWSDTSVVNFINRLKMQ